jgi:hypothetical protein
MNIPSVLGADNTISGTYGNDNVAYGFFTDTFNFSFPTAGFGGATITSIMTKLLATDINFTSVKFNGVELNTASFGTFEARYLDDLVVASGPQKIVVEGWSGGNGSYNGTVSFAAGVPEPATWAMMIIGFGAAGAMVRNRRKLVPTVA